MRKSSEFYRRKSCNYMIQTDYQYGKAEKGGITQIYKTRTIKF